VIIKNCQKAVECYNEINTKNSGNHKTIGKVFSVFILLFKIAASFFRSRSLKTKLINSKTYLQEGRV
jgi:hypothetical protein